MDVDVEIRIKGLTILARILATSLTNKRQNTCYPPEAAPNSVNRFEGDLAKTDASDESD